MRRAKKRGGHKDRVFGCDLQEHLIASSQDIPQVLRCCSDFIEEHGVVDGIYRLSGVSSNTQKLRSDFESEGCPDLSKDVYLQDIHCVSSLCKAYFRELPNPLLTYQLYDKFADAVALQLEEERLVKIRDVLKELPDAHYRTLQYLMRHLVRMATHAPQTNMHARNLAIVWAPNLLRSKDIEASGFNGTAAFMEVRVQSIVVEFILTHVTQLFDESGHAPTRRQSLPSPSLINHDDQFFRAIPFQHPTNISPGDAPLPMRPYHSIIDSTEKRKGSLKAKKWKSIVNLGARLIDPKKKSKYCPKVEKDKVTLRPAKSMDSLSDPRPQDGHRPAPPSQQPAVCKSSCPTQSETGAVGGAGSAYAVTYRRGGGASVSLVTGGSGTPGTYRGLDSGGALTDPQQVPSRSPCQSSRAERRAGIHISGPFSVTVPLHITSGLALGVLQGVAGNSNHARAEEEGEEGKREEVNECVQTVHGQENIVNGERLSVQESMPKEEEEDEEELRGEERRRSEVKKESDDVTEAFHTVEPCEESQELPLDFQDTFGFLDHMDSSNPYTANEFSVEAPCYDEGEDDDGYEAAEPLSFLRPSVVCRGSQVETRPLSCQIQRPVTHHPHSRACKTQSLPYRCSPAVLAHFASSDEDLPYADADDEEEADVAENEEDENDEDDRLCVSLPANVRLHELCGELTPTHSDSPKAQEAPEEEPGESVEELQKDSITEHTDVGGDVELQFQDDLERMQEEDAHIEVDLTAEESDCAESQPSSQSCSECCGCPKQEDSMAPLVSSEEPIDEVFTENDPQQEATQEEDLLPIPDMDILENLVIQIDSGQEDTTQSDVLDENELPPPPSEILSHEQEHIEITEDQDEASGNVKEHEGTPRESCEKDAENHKHENEDQAEHLVHPGRQTSGIIAEEEVITPEPDVKPTDEVWAKTQPNSSPDTMNDQDIETMENPEDNMTQQAEHLVSLRRQMSGIPQEDDVIGLEPEVKATDDGWAKTQLDTSPDTMNDHDTETMENPEDNVTQSCVGQTQVDEAPPADIAEQKSCGAKLDLGPGLGRTVVVTKQTQPKVHQVKAVPTVPPKSLHSRQAAMTLRQRELERASVCFDEAVARETERRGRERDKEKVREEEPDRESATDR